MVKNESQRQLIIIGIIAFVIYFLFRHQYIFGDACIYADNILRLRFNDISIHTGYYLLGFVFSKVLSLFGTEVDTSLILLSNLSGVAAACYGYLLISEIRGDRLIAFLSAIALVFSGVFIEYSSQAEVYIPQTAFIISGMYYLLRRKYCLSGVLYSIALLITPLSIFVFPVYCYLGYDRKVKINSILRFLISSGIIYLPIFFLIYEDLLWGRRGLLGISSNMPWQPVKASVFNLVYVFIKSFNTLVPVICIGYILLWFKNRRNFWLMTVVLASLSYLILKLSRFDLETAMLPIFIFLCYCGIEALLFVVRKLSKTSLGFNIIAGSVIIIFSILSLMIWVGADRLSSPNIVVNNQFEKTMSNFNDGINLGDLLVCSFWDGVAFAYYTRDNMAEELETTMGNKRWLDIAFLKPSHLTERSANTSIYVKEAYSPSQFARLLMGKEELKRRYSENSVKARIEKMIPGMILDESFVSGDIIIYKINFAGYGENVLSKTK